MTTIVRLRANIGTLNRGEIAGFPDKEAADYIVRGLAVEVDEDGQPIEQALSTDTGGGTGDGDAKGNEPDFSSMSKEELVALAEKREVTVTRSDGEGEPLKADYVRALTEASEGAGGDEGAGDNEGEGESDDTGQSDEPSS